MPKKSLFTAIAFLISSITFSQISRPKLVIGLVIDQMRWDYLYRYDDLYSTNGFKRLLGEGFSCENTLIPYLPTYTAPGHTCIYTGSIPFIHGIIGNNWFDKATNKNVYCTDDSTVSTVGSNSKWGKMSPRNLWVTTITDELRLSNNFKSKVIGIALKDRGSIFPAGHAANASYWYDEVKGIWITSTYYMKELPAWVNQFNAKKEPEAFMAKDWNTLLPVQKYDQSTPDDKIYEHPIQGETTVTFPHKLSQITTQKYQAFRYTPFANTYSFNFAKAAIENENLGGNNVTDFVALSISSTDFIGHWFGPNSVEMEDTYLRLDKDIEDFLSYLDNKIGKGNYLLFLTADHGVAQIPSFLEEHNIPTGDFKTSSLKTELNELAEKKFNIKSAIINMQNNQLYLDIEKLKIEKQPGEIKTFLINSLKQKSFIVDAFETNNALQVTMPDNLKRLFVNGYNTKRSGDIQFTLRHGYFDGDTLGTTHGTWALYDSHIPLVWFGWNIKQGKTNRETYMTDIAPTVAAKLRIQMPSGSIGKVIEEVSGY